MANVAFNRVFNGIWADKTGSNHLSKSDGAGDATGYEVSKQTGISRSNVYRALAGLVEKGAAYTSEENATKYMGIDVEEFCSNKIRRMEQYKDFRVNMPKEHEETEGYLTVSGDEQIQHKIKNMLLSANKRVYLSMSAKNLKKFIPEISQLINTKVQGCGTFQ